MPKSHPQLFAVMQWEFACERLRSVLQPPVDAPEPEPSDLATALELIEERFEAVRNAFEPSTEDADEHRRDQIPTQATPATGGATAA